VTGLLLDTHVLLWFMEDAALRPGVRRAIADPDRSVKVSVASLWEVAIKQGLGRLKPPEDPAEAAEAVGFELLGIAPTHARAVIDLPLHHRDPFDRMLVAQAKTERLTLVTRDRRMRDYDVKVMPA